MFQELPTLPTSLLKKPIGNTTGVNRLFGSSFTSQHSLDLFLCSQWSNKHSTSTSPHQQQQPLFTVEHISSSSSHWSQWSISAAVAAAAAAIVNSGAYQRRRRSVLQERTIRATSIRVLRSRLILSSLGGLTLSACGFASQAAMSDKVFYRKDGVRITHDPYSPGMKEKYGAPGCTDQEGFDPYADSVGPGIYGGVVKRNDLGQVVIGRQYQNHNPRPGPIYAGGGYTPINAALGNKQRLLDLLEKYPDLANDVSTGGASPLHMCGMSGNRQDAADILIRHGADIEALDTYGFTPLARMASNNLANAAKVLLDAGADPDARGNPSGPTPLQVARSSEAHAMAKLLLEYRERKSVPIKKVVISNAGAPECNGEYLARTACDMPRMFEHVCNENGWSPQGTWSKLSGVNRLSQNCNEISWFEHASNGSFIYFNVSDNKWWIDGPDGLGRYTSLGPSHAVPGYPKGAGGSHGWSSLNEKYEPVPTVLIYREMTEISDLERKET